MDPYKKFGIDQKEHKRENRYRFHMQVMSISSKKYKLRPGSLFYFDLIPQKTSTKAAQKPDSYHRPNQSIDRH